MSSLHANIPATIPLLQGPTQHLHVLYWNYVAFLTVNEEPQSNNPPVITRDLTSKPETDTCSFHDSKIPKGVITSAMTWQFPPNPCQLPVPVTSKSPSRVIYSCPALLKVPEKCKLPTLHHEIISPNDLRKRLWKKSGLHGSSSLTTVTSSTKAGSNLRVPPPPSVSCKKVSAS